MTLGSEDIKRIAEEVLPAIKEYVAEERLRSPVGIQPEMLDRIVTVEGELKTIGVELRAQREVMETRFAAMDKRFEDQSSAFEKRFAAIDKRFEDQRAALDKRFDAIDKRFEDQRAALDKRFDAIDKRFEDQLAALDKRFDDQKDTMDQRFTTLTWGLGLGVTLLSVLMTVYQFLGG